MKQKTMQSYQVRLAQQTRYDLGHTLASHASTIPNASTSAPVGLRNATGEYRCFLNFIIQPPSSRSICTPQWRCLSGCNYTPQHHRHATGNVFQESELNVNQHACSQQQGQRTQSSRTDQDFTAAQTHVSLTNMMSHDVVLTLMQPVAHVVHCKLFPAVQLPFQACSVL